MYIFRHVDTGGGYGSFFFVHKTGTKYVNINNTDKQHQIQKFTTSPPGIDCASEFSIPLT